MQNAQRITSRILSEAEQSKAALLEAAKADAAQKLAAAQAQADEILKQAAQETAVAAQAQKKRRLSAIDSELRKEVLSTRRTLLDNVFDKALQKLTDRPSADQVAMMASRIVEASPDGRGEIMLSAKDAAALGGQLLEKVQDLYSRSGLKPELKISSRTINTSGGFVLKIGDIDYNYTYDALVKASKEELESKVAALLFADETSGQS